MKRLTLIATIPIDLALLLSLASCDPTDVISDVVNVVSNEAAATVEQVGLVSADQALADTETYTMIGGTGQLTSYQVTTLLHLSWPQSYGAIESALGTPHTRNIYADYYQLPNGHSVTIYYAGGDATGYSLGDSGE